MKSDSNIDRTKEAIVLFSGGLDSTIVMYVAKEQGYQVHALSFRYNQRHSIELIRARLTGLSVGVVSHTFLEISRDLFAKSSLVKSHAVPPKNREIDSSIPSTYVPARNILFLSHALALGETLGIQDIFIGANSVDYSGYPDCRIEFLQSFEKMANLGTRIGIENSPFKIHAPLILMRKADIIREGVRFGIDFRMTWSCYDPQNNGKPCQECDACVIRARGFSEAGLADPLIE